MVMEDRLTFFEKIAIFIYYSLFAFGSGVWATVFIPEKWKWHFAIGISALLILLATYVRFLVRKAKQNQAGAF